MNLTLTRNYLDDCTLGKLDLNGIVFPTMERARTGDHPCIPEGTYKLIPHSSPKHGAVYAFVGDSVYENAVPEGKIGRCLIELHIANTAHELLGCVAPGLRTGFIGQAHAVLDSEKAFNQISGILGRTETHQVTIRDASQP